MTQKVNLKWAIPVMAIMSAQLLNSGCNNHGNTPKQPATDTAARAAELDGYDSNFVVAAQSFADLQLLRYQVPGSRP